MMHNIGPFHVNGNVLTKHGRTVIIMMKNI